MNAKSLEPYIRTILVSTLGRPKFLQPGTEVNWCVFVPSPLIRRMISRLGTCGLGYVSMRVDVGEPNVPLPTA